MYLILHDSLISGLEIVWIVVRLLEKIYKRFLETSMTILERLECHTGDVDTIYSLDDLSQELLIATVPLLSIYYSDIIL